VTADFGDLPVLDVCLICVKAYDLPAVLDGISPKILEDSLVLPLLNGVDIYERIRRSLKRGMVFPACVYVGTHIERYGKVTQRGGACRILIGPDPSVPGFIPSLLLDTLRGAGINHTWFDEVYPEIWTKFIFIAAFGLVTAAFDKTLGEVRDSVELMGLVRSVMEEILAIAKTQAIKLPEDIVTGTLEKAAAFPSETKTSFQRDFERYDKPDERDLFSGTIIRLGRRLGIRTPATSRLQEMLDARKPQR
jgi:2-dehydropantoate 2-reductase